MRKIRYLVLLLLFVHTLTLAQNVSVSGALVGNGSYATLTDAFAALNTGAQTGATITVSLLNDTYEGTGTAVLNTGTWTSITIVPVGQARSILGATTAGQPMINLNGADRVHFNGLLGGQKGLTLFNSTNSTMAGTSTIRFSAAAQNNSISHCKVYGSSRANFSAEGGNIVFGSAGNGGNSNNSITNSELGAGNADLPSRVIFSLGSNNAGDLNWNNQIVGCDFYDYFSTTHTSSAILLVSGCGGWTIRNNRFYQNALRIKTNGAHSDIRIESTSIGGNHVVTHNICGTHPTASPAYSQFEMSAGSYTPIYFGPGIKSLMNTVANNLIRDILIQVPGSSLNQVTFSGIVFESGPGYIRRNRIGSKTDPSSIVINCGSGSATTAIAIMGGLEGTQIIDSNEVGGIQINNPAGTAHFYGINLFGTYSTCTLARNTIGYVNAPIQLHGIASGNLIGINATASLLTVTDNAVAYLSSDQPSAASPGSYKNIGIYADNGTFGYGNFARNTVHSLAATHPNSATGLAGIQVYNFDLVQCNNVHSLAVSTENPGAMLVGIDLMLGNLKLFNNMVRLGYTSTGAAITAGIQIFGIHNKTGRPMVDHNSIYIGGSGVTDTADTYAMYSQTGVPPSRFLNNIFYNARSNGSGTGSHYAITHGGYPSSMPPSDGNDLLADGIGGKIGRLNGIDLVDIFDWRIYTGQDFGSVSYNPNFLNPTGDALTGDLHIGSLTPIEGIGVGGLLINMDIDGQARNILTPNDAGADAGNFTRLLIQQPEAYLTGNALQILDGDVTPSVADGTDFGAMGSCVAAMSRTFVLHNLGNSALNVTGATVTGSSAFTVLPFVPSTVAYGQSINIVVQFSSSVAVTASATVSVFCNDADEGTYSFVVQGVASPDTLPPTAVCQVINAPIAANGIATVNAAALGANSTDNCVVTSYVASPAQFSCAQIGTQAVTLTIADAAGLSATCNGSVNVVDQLAPQALCQNTSLVLGVGGTAQLTPAAINGGSTDNCGIDSIWTNIMTFSCAQVGPNAVQLRVRDHAGHVGICTATVTVTESQAPAALCQPVALLLDNTGQASLTPAQLDAGSTDNCGIVGRASSQTLFTCADVGVQPVVLTVTDGSGNTATCSTQVSVQDLIPPVLTCADLTLALDSSGAATLTPAMVGTATDACGIASYTLSQTHFSCVDLGALPVSLVAVDAHGNSDTCAIVLTATSTAPLAVSISASPVDSCGHHLACAGQANATATVGVAGACAPYTYAWSSGQTGAAATGLGAGTYSVTVQAASGQQAVQSVTLTAPPALSLSLSATPSCFSSNTGSLSAFGSGGQACQSYSYVWSNGATSPILSGLSAGNYTVTLTDAAGCSSQASATVSTWPTPSLTITHNQGNLVATSGFVSYQWYDASGQIPGATAQQFTPSASGIFHVVATDSNGCEWTSASFPLTVVSNAAALPGWEAVVLYPNPGAGVFRFAVGQAIDGPIWLSVTDLSGKVLLREELAVLESGRAFDLSWVAAGVYLVELRAADGVQRRFRWLRE